MKALLLAALIAPDFQSHMLASYGLGLTLSAAAHQADIRPAWFWGALGCLIVGSAKELLDPAFGGKREWRDMLANGFGASGAIAVSFALDFQ